jgi:hypothetical protein
MANPRPLTSLYKVHRVLIGAGIVCALTLVLWGVRQYRAGREGSPLVIAAIGLAIAVGLGLYLRYFNAKIARS